MIDLSHHELAGRGQPGMGLQPARSQPASDDDAVREVDTQCRQGCEFVGDEQVDRSEF